MRQFTVKEIYALDGKGKTIADMIEPVHPTYCLDLGENPGKTYLFALSRRGRDLEQADSLRLVVTPDSNDSEQKNVRVNVLFTDTFNLERVSSGDYWDDIPELQRFRIQAKLADEIMERAKPLFPFQREAHPYQGVTFAVTGLEELETLFPPE